MSYCPWLYRWWPNCRWGGESGDGGGDGGGYDNGDSGDGGDDIVVVTGDVCVYVLMWVVYMFI